MNRLNLLVAALSLYTGCADDESAPQELQAFLESLADSGCEALAECAPARDSQAFVVATVLSSRTACQAYIKSLRKARVDYESLVANGVLDFDAAQAGRCASAFKGTCEEYSFEDLPECRNVFRGHANIGAECDRDFDCIGDAWCARASDGQCHGVCQARLPPGGLCSADAACSSATTPTACAFGMCAPVEDAVALPNGECGELGATSHLVRTTCPDGFFCNNSDVTDIVRRCVPRVARGEACVRGQDLCEQQGDGCVSEGSTSVCRPIKVQSLVGASCSGTVGSEPGICNVFARLACDGGACADFGEWIDGDGCGGDGPFPIECAVGFECVDGSCRAQQEESPQCVE